MKSGKAPGVCGIDAEMLKAGGMVAAEWLHRVIEVALAKGEVANDWKKAVIVPLHKKGSKMVCSNYRGISLLSIPSKVYAVYPAKCMQYTQQSVCTNLGQPSEKQSGK